MFLTLASSLVVVVAVLVMHGSHWHSADLLSPFLLARSTQHPSADSLRYGFYSGENPAVTHIVFGLLEAKPLRNMSIGRWSGPLRQLDMLGQPNFDETFGERVAAAEHEFQEYLVELCNNISNATGIASNQLVEDGGTHCIAWDLKEFSEEHGLGWPLKNLAATLQNESFRAGADRLSLLRTGARVSDGRLQLLWISFNTTLKNMKVHRLEEGKGLDPNIKLNSIAQAWYGSEGHEWDAQYGWDVTMLLKSWLQSGESVNASNLFFGDPCPGISKVLLVRKFLDSQATNEVEVEAASRDWNRLVRPLRREYPGVLQTSSAWLWLRIQKEVKKGVFTSALTTMILIVPVLLLTDQCCFWSCQSLMHAIFALVCTGAVICTLPGLMALMGLGATQYGAVGPVQAVAFSIAASLAIRNPVYVLRECQLAVDNAPPALKLDEVLREALASSSMGVLAWSAIHFSCGFLLALRPEYELPFEFGHMFALTSILSLCATMLLLAVLLAVYYDENLENNVMTATRSMFQH